LLNIATISFQPHKQRLLLGNPQPSPEAAVD